MKDRIKKIRKELNLTQQKFADKLGVQRNTIAMYEMGRTAPSDAVFLSICREFNVSEEWLRNGTGEMFRPNPSSALDALASEYGLDRSSRVVLEKFARLSPEVRKNIIDYLMDIATALRDENVDLSSIPDITAAEAAYEKSLGIAPSAESSALNTTDGTDGKNADTGT